MIVALLQGNASNPWWWEIIKAVLAGLAGGGLSSVVAIKLIQRQLQKQTQEQAQKQSQKQAQEVAQRQQQEVTFGAEEHDRVFEVECGCYPDRRRTDPNDKYYTLPVPKKKVSVHIFKGKVTAIMCDQFWPDTQVCGSRCNRRADQRCVCLLTLPQRLTPPASGG